MAGDSDDLAADRPDELPVTDQPEAPPVERPGAQIGPYKLLEVLGEGGFGVVYRAVQTHPVRRQVALKIIKPGMDSRQVIARFEAERQALAMMDHPGIAKVYDAGATDLGRPYFVMELVKGVPITHYCDTAKLPVADRLGLFVTVCQAVQHAHQKGIIHRDIKPSNVLVTIQDGKPSPKVIDFGVAKATAEPLTERTLFTRQGQLIGTPGYMSPEQAEMSALDVDTRTDIYSLGALLYELLTGSLPLADTDLRRAGLAEIQRIIRDVDPPRPSARCSTLGEKADQSAQRRRTTRDALVRQLRGDLDWITMKAMDKDRTRRYATAEALAEDVHRHLASEPVEAGPPSAAYRLRKFARRNRGPVAAAVTIALLLVASTIISTALYWQAKSNERAARAAEKQQRFAEQAARASAGREAAAAGQARQAAAAAQRALYANQMALATRELDAGQVNVARRLLDAALPEMRGWEWHHLDGLCDVSCRTLTGHVSWVLAVTFSPDGKLIASGSWDKTVHIWDFLAAREVRRILHGEIVDCVRFSPDGKRIASSGQKGSLKIWEVESGRKLLSLEGHDDSVRSLQFSPDGSRLFSAGKDRTIRVWDAMTGEEVHRLGAHEEAIIVTALSPDGRHLACGGWGGELKVWDTGGTGLVATLAGQTGSIEGLGWDAEGRRLVSRTVEGVIKIWDARTAKPLRTFPDIAGGGGVAFFAAGEDMVMTTAKALISLWNVQTGQRIAALCGHQENISGTGAALSPDGRYIASGGWDDVVKVWDLRACRRTSAIPAKQHWVDGVAFSPKRDWLASTGFAGTVKLWDLDTWESILTLQGPGKSLRSVTFRPDGNRIAAGGSEGLVSLWDLAEPADRTDLRGHEVAVHTVAFSPDGELLASGGGDRTVIVWHPKSNKYPLTLRGHTGAVNCVAFAPDGRWLASAGDDGTVRLWDVRSGMETHAFREHQRSMGFRTVAFSPDGRYLASAGADQTIILWDAKSYAQVRTFRGHSELINSLAFSPDGTRLVSGGEDNSIRLWDVETADEVLTRYCEDFINTVAFSPDGRRIAGAGREGLIRIVYSGPRPQGIEAEQATRLSPYDRRTSPLAAPPMLPTPPATTRPTCPSAWDGNAAPIVAFDDFDGKLALPWEVRNPDTSHYSLAARRGFLTITTQKGGPGPSDCRNVFLLKNPCGDRGNFQVTLRVTGFESQDARQRVGVLAHTGDSGWLTWEMLGGKSHPHLVSGFGRGDSTPRLQLKCVLDRPESLWLRLAKRGNRYVFSSSEDGTAFEEHDLVRWAEGSVQGIGLVASNGPEPNAPEIEARLDCVEVRRLPDTAPDEPPRPFFVPGEFLKLPEDAKGCAERLGRIHAALRKYQQDHRDLPGELVDLVPKYLAAEELVCPNAAPTKAPAGDGPRGAYSWQWSRNRSVPPEVPGASCYRDWKLLQLRAFGHVLPIVRCNHERVGCLNLSWGGQVYRSPAGWEWVFWPDFSQHIDLRRDTGLHRDGAAPGQDPTTRRALGPATKAAKPTTRLDQASPDAGEGPSASEGRTP